jgi:hypothetical protein
LIDADKGRLLVSRRKQTHAAAANAAMTAVRTKAISSSGQIPFARLKYATSRKPRKDLAFEIPWSIPG